MFRIDHEKFGTFVSALRKEKGMTQKDLAERLFVSDKAVSKWERGLSLPDISLLQPMADILGVSVTELLSGQYIQAGASQEVEQIMEGAVAALTAQEEERQRQNRRRWGLLYAAAFFCGILELMLFGRRLWDEMFSFLLVPLLLAAIFGIHFCFLAPEKLPVFYDQYKINFYSSGAFRMNVPGVHFNNSNWPHILHALRVWCTAMMAGWVPMYAVLHWTASVLLPREALLFAMMFPFFLFFFGTLFGPVYVMGRKYE